MYDLALRHTDAYLSNAEEYHGRQINFSIEPGSRLGV